MAQTVRLGGNNSRPTERTSGAQNTHDRLQVLREVAAEKRNRALILVLSTLILAGAGGVTYHLLPRPSAEAHLGSAADSAASPVLDEPPAKNNPRSGDSGEVRDDGANTHPR